MCSEDNDYRKKKLSFEHSAFTFYLTKESKAKTTKKAINIQLKNNSYQLLVR